MKRLFDICIALTMLLLTFPILLLTALVIRINLGSPIIFKQKRPGLNAKIFILYKFRTMSEKKDNKGELLADSERLTKIGRLIRLTSLDELPQLFNVLKGDMSLVGPRPLLVEYLPLYSLQQTRRHEIRPGITGWAQINGRNALSWEEKFELDVWYVDNNTFRLDIKILWLTLYKVLARKGISAQGEATMPRFTGSERGKTPRRSI